MNTPPLPPKPLADQPAFAGISGHFTDRDLHDQIINGGVTYSSGMTYSQWLVGMALQGLLSNPEIYKESKIVAAATDDDEIEILSKMAAGAAQTVIAELEK